MSFSTSHFIAEVSWRGSATNDVLAQCSQAKLRYVTKSQSVAQWRFRRKAVVTKNEYLATLTTYQDGRTAASSSFLCRSASSNIEARWNQFNFLTIAEQTLRHIWKNSEDYLDYNSCINMNQKCIA